VIFLKVIIWRVLSISITLIVTMILSGDIKEATKLTFAIHSFLIVSHLIFETAWKRMLEDKLKSLNSKD